MSLYLGNDKVASGAIYGAKGRVLDEYLNTEVKTNKVWKDGKPIYRTILVTTTVNADIAHNIKNIDTITDLTTKVKQSSGMNFKADSASTFANKTIYVVYNDKISNVTGEFTVTIEYTKTTDAVASGLIPQQLGRNFEVYSDEEMIVGTFFGKPLYRKIVKYTLAEPTSYPSYPSFDTGIRDIDYAMIDVYFSNGTDNLAYFRNRSTFDGYLQRSTGKYHFILQNNVASSALAGLYVFMFQYTKTTD